MAHDPVGDPLTPYWREKVERSFQSGLSRGNYARRPARKTDLTDLTDYERDVLVSVSLGATIREIAALRGSTPQAAYGALDRALEKVAP